jgi:S-adenosylmethionine/arginine decarboxylase-like enzyme
MIKHKHLIIRATVDKPFTECGKTASWLCDIVDEIGMTITDHGGPHVDYVEKEGNCGIAGMVMIETSHISLHIWDKQDPPLLQMDVYSCADYNENAVIAFLSEMEPSHIDYMLVDREQSLDVSEETIHHIVSPDFVSRIDPLGLSF